MIRLSLAVILCLMTMNPAHAARDDRGYTPMGASNCAEYVLAYDRNRVERTGPDKAITEFLLDAGWIMGYITAYNRMADNSKGNIADGLTLDGITLWLSDYCRKNPHLSLASAMQELTVQLEN